MKKLAWIVLAVVFAVGVVAPMTGCEVMEEAGDEVEEATD
jgi:hypothetical protein